MKFRHLAALLLAPLSAWAAYPSMSSLKPHGGQIGADVKLTIAGAQLDDFEDLMFYTPGFKVKSVESRASNKVELTLSIDKSVRAGNHVMRVRTKSGISHMRQFFASPFANVEEKEPNTEFATAQPIALKTWSGHSAQTPTRPARSSPASVMISASVSLPTTTALLIPK